ncbi:xylulokinase [Sutcliffiella horikoshii]|uniref:xylulokinase n=1 Tax=Sutcliffiella horikoshii TaxID=79883 RepID=UPI00203DD95F|nr:xylulokinase [Sutcliffiella horikoshii]MCM3619842.1 xylulokinase [Sutcliffiella horikoshii]
MKYVVGIDLGTSAVKVLLVNQLGEVVKEVSKEYPLLHEKSGYSEQEPEVWVTQTIAGLTEVLNGFSDSPEVIEGISFSGQMHGLVLLDENCKVLRNAILWNDTRTTEECQEIYDIVGKEKLLEITKNPALEGFTLPKILWVKKNEPEIFARVRTFVLPKDYLRYRLSGELHMDFSDAAGTLLLNINEKKWSKEILKLLDIPEDICPALVNSHERVGKIIPGIAEATGLSPLTSIIAGGADNACGAIGSGILKEGMTLCSIGTSGVVLSYETTGDKDFDGKVHYFNHGAPDSYYTMGVTLAAGYSLSWFKNVFANGETFEDLVQGVDSVPVGANGLMFTPYVAGERTPYADASIRASFIGMDTSHERRDFVRAVMEGITFSLNESIAIFRKKGKSIDTVVSTGGGTKNDTWLQMQADVFNARIIKLSSEQGPGMGAAMLAAYGCGWYASLEECAEEFLHTEKEFLPNGKNTEKYEELFSIYLEIYKNTKELNRKLVKYRK